MTEQQNSNVKEPEIIFFDGKTSLVMFIILVFIAYKNVHLAFIILFIFAIILWSYIVDEHNKDLNHHKKLNKYYSM